VLSQKLAADCSADSIDEIAMFTHCFSLCSCQRTVGVKANLKDFALLRNADLLRWEPVSVVFTAAMLP
jgi:hypothetical protein